MIVKIKQIIPIAGAAIKNTIVNTKQKMIILIIKDEIIMIKNIKRNTIIYIAQIIKHDKNAKTSIKIIIVTKYTIEAKIIKQNPMLIVEHIQIAFGGNTQDIQILKQQ